MCIWLLLGFNVYNKERMELLWIEDFPLFLPKEDGTEGEWWAWLSEVGLHETEVAESSLSDS